MPFPAWLMQLKEQSAPHWVSDTRQLQAGDIFVALSGTHNKGVHFIPQAIEKGAVAIMSDTPLPLGHKQLKVPHWVYPSLQKELSQLLQAWYPGFQHLSLVGVTGTNGKSSITYLLAQLWTYLTGEKTGIMGTLGIGSIDDLAPNSLTTPDLCSVYRYLDRAYQKGIRKLAMEVSSHALVQKRIQGLAFQGVIFSNLTQDHLDYHGNMENYFLAKQALLSNYPSQYRILNFDDPYARRFIQACRAGKTPLPPQTPFMVYSLHEVPIQPDAIGLSMLGVSGLKRSEAGIQGQFQGQFGSLDFEFPLLGDFQLSNALAAILMCLSEGFSLQAIVSVLPKLKPVPGRLQRLGGGHLPNVVIDFAHTEDALEHLLSALQPYSKQRTYLVFGCGGERDRGKRPKMLEVGLRYADSIILTADNPRQEPLSQIMADIREGNETHPCIQIELDREKAVRKAIQQAKPGDMVVLAGKGHETVQIMSHETRPYSEIQVAKQALQAYHQ